MATTYYVAKAINGGSDAHTSVEAQSLVTPWLTLTHALSQIAGGNRIEMRAGTYDEVINNNVPFGSSGFPTVIANYNGEIVWLRPTSTAGNTGRVIYLGSDIGAAVVHPTYIQIDGINVDGRLFPNGPVFFDTRGGSNPSHLDLLNLEVINFDAVGGTAAAVVFGGHGSGRCTFCSAQNLIVHGTAGPYAIYITGDDNLVDGCDLYAVSSLGVHVYDSILPPQRNTIRNTRIHDISQSAFFSVTDTRLGGILLSGDDHVVENCAIWNIRLASGTPNPYGAVFCYTGARAKIRHVTAYNCDGAPVAIGSGASSVSVQNVVGYRCDVAGVSGAATQSTNYFGSNPMFADPSTGDFRPLPGSPLIDAGVTIPAVTTDLAGVVRPQGSAYDIGAYEGTSGGTVPVIAPPPPPQPTPNPITLFDIPALPLVSGFGVKTRGAYSGSTAPQIVRVTTLADSGAGSLRAALTTSGPRIILFEVSGTIVLLTPILINGGSYLTVAGQTAPTPGILIRGGGSGACIEFQNTHDVLFQHLEILPGLTSTCNSGLGARGNCYNFVFDHVTLGWTIDDGFYFYTNVRDCTLWRCLQAEAFDTAPGFSSGCSSLGVAQHGYGCSIQAADNIAIIQSLFALTKERTPLFRAESTGVLLNCVQYACPEGLDLLDALGTLQPILVSSQGNRIKARTTPTGDHAIGVRYLTSSSKLYNAGDGVDDPSVTLTAFTIINSDGVDPRVGTAPISVPGYTILSDSAAYTAVTTYAGARPTDRSAFATRVLGYVAGRTGAFIAQPSDVGGYPAVTVNRRSLTAPDNAHDILTSGYTRLEEWLQAFSRGVGDNGGQGTSGGAVTAPTGGTLDPTGGTTPPSGTQGTPPTEGTGGGNVGAGAPIVVGVSVSGATAQGTRRLLVSGTSFPTDLTVADLTVTRDGTPVAVSSIESVTATLLVLVLAADFLGGSHTYCVNIGTAANRQLLFGRTHRFSGGLNYTFSPFTFGGATSNIAPLTDVDVRQPMSVAGTFRLLKVTTDVRAPSGKSWQIVCLKNGVAQALTVSITESTDVDPAGSYTVRDIANSVHVAVGDTITFEYRRIPTSSGTVNPGVMDFAVEFDADTTGTSMYGFTSTLLGTGSVSYFPLLNGRAGNLTSGLQVSVIPGSCNVVRLDLRQTAGAGSGGSGKSYTYTIRKSGVDQDGTAGTPDTRVTLLETATTGSLTGSFSMVAGDYLELKVTPTGTPTSVKVGVGIAIASSDGSNKYILPGCNLTTVGGATAAKYLSISSTDNVNDAWDGTESNQAVHAGIAGVNLLGLTARPSASPGGGAKTITLTLRKNFADASPALSLVFNVAGSLSTTPASAITLADGALAAMQETPSGTPTTVTLSWAFIAQYAAASICVDVLTPTDPCADALPVYEDPCAIVTPLWFGVIQAIATPAVEDPTYDTFWFANTPLRDPSPYYGGFKSGRLLTHGPWRRAASQFVTGSFEAQSGSFTLADTDGVVRDFVDAHGGSLRGASVTIYLISDAQRRAGGTPRIIAQGVITDDTLDPQRKYTAQVRDVIGAGYSILTEETQVPQRLVLTDFPGPWATPNSDTPNLTLTRCPIVFGTGSICRDDEAASPPRGRIPVLYVGTRTCGDGVTRHVGMIAGHACAGGVMNVYDESDPPVSPSWGSDGFAPSKSGWAAVNGSAALYSAINGRWYTLIALNVGSALGDGLADGSKKLWANCAGFEDVGDGTGAEIVLSALQRKHILINFELQSWESGVWLPSPQFETFPGSGVYICRVDTVAFDAAAIVSEQYVPGGMLGAGVIGPNGQQQSIRQELAEGTRDAFLWFGVNRYQQYTVRMLDQVRATMLDDTDPVTDVRDTLASKPLTSVLDTDLLMNHLRFSGDLNLRTGKFRTAEKAIGVSVSRYLSRVENQSWLYVSDTITGNALADAMLLVRATARRRVTWRQSLCGLKHDVLQCVYVRHYSDAAKGLTNRAVLILSMAVNADSSVDVEALSIDDLLLGADDITRRAAASSTGSTASSAGNTSTAGPSGPAGPIGPR